jgi:hypothetical protein
MRIDRFTKRGKLFAFSLCVLFSGLGLSNCPAFAVAVGQVDEFFEDDYQNWGGAAAGVLPDVGPTGDGDFSLLVEASGFPGGAGSRLVTFNGGVGAPVATQWTGDWIAAGIRTLSLDVLNPNDFALTMWLGIAGPGPPGFAGSGDSYVSKSGIPVPADGLWHSVEFSVLPGDFDAWGSGSDPAAALANVLQMRIMHAVVQDWRGATGDALMLIDNIRAIPEPSAWSLAAMAAATLRRFRKRNRL